MASSFFSFSVAYMSMFRADLDEDGDLTMNLETGLGSKLEYCFSGVSIGTIAIGVPTYYLRK